MLSRRLKLVVERPDQCLMIYVTGQYIEVHSHEQFIGRVKQTKRVQPTARASACPDVGDSVIIVGDLCILLTPDEELSIAVARSA